MNFVYPHLLWALLAVLVPIIIHLFHFRRHKTIYFSNTRFIQQIQQQKKKQQQLKHLIILLLRILAVVALVFAFAQAFIPLNQEAKNTEKGAAVGIYIDNSFSMSSINENGSLLELSKQKASEIMDAYHLGDDFLLLDNEASRKNTYFVSQEEAKDLLFEVKQSSNTTQLPDVISQYKQALSKSTKKRKDLYLISDLQKRSFTFNDMSSDSSVNIYVVPIQAKKTNNIFIDSSYFESPLQYKGHQAKLHVVITNISNQKWEKLPVKLFLNQEQKAIAGLDLDANSSAEIVMNFTHKESGFASGYIAIDDYPITFDDQYYISFPVYESLPVLTISAARANNAYLNALYRTDEQISNQIFDENKLDYSIFNQQNLIILNGIQNPSGGLINSLKDFVSKGGVLFIFPAKKMELTNYELLMSSFAMQNFKTLDTSVLKVKNIDFNHPLFTDVFEQKDDRIDLPSVKKHYVWQPGIGSGLSAVLSLQNGDIFLGEKDYEEGKILISSVPLSESFSNFQNHAIFVPVMMKAAFLAKSKQKISYTIGQNIIKEVPDIKMERESILKIKKQDSGYEFIPEMKNMGIYREYIVYAGMAKEPGNYFVHFNDETVDAFSMNYNRLESHLDFYNADDLNKIIQDKRLNNIKIIKAPDANLKNSIESMSTGVKLWHWFLLLALLCLLLEILLIRLWKG